MILDVEATAAFTVATECRYGRTKGSKSPLATEGSSDPKKGLFKSDTELKLLLINTGTHSELF